MEIVCPFMLGDDCGGSGYFHKMILKFTGRIIHLMKANKFKLSIKTRVWVSTNCDSNGKESAHNARDPGSIPGSRRSLGDGNCNPLHYSCLQNSMDREPGGLLSVGSQRVGHN